MARLPRTKDQPVDSQQPWPIMQPEHQSRTTAVQLWQAHPMDNHQWRPGYKEHQARLCLCFRSKTPSISIPLWLSSSPYLKICHNSPCISLLSNTPYSCRRSRMLSRRSSYSRTFSSPNIILSSLYSNLKSSCNIHNLSISIIISNSQLTTDNHCLNLNTPSNSHS